jgi:hypothetical protein
MAVMDSLTAREAALEVLGSEHADVLRFVERALRP